MFVFINCYKNKKKKKKKKTLTIKYSIRLDILLISGILWISFSAVIFEGLICTDYFLFPKLNIKSQEYLQPLCTLPHILNIENEFKGA